ncbi:hypothetical protein C8R45DRAFT_123419 [Mycena sanguinolenta]|nr:hypothetical protein C8R45DRAFT_123419 [Mycena sanguinolenta]
MLYSWIHQGLWFTTFLIAFSAVLAEPIHLPLVRAGRSSVSPKDLFASNSLRRRYVSAGNLIRDQSRAAPEDFNLTNGLTDSYYFTELSIGTPPQTFKMWIDIGGSDVYVAGRPAPSRNVPQPCLYTTRRCPRRRLTKSPPCHTV